MRNYFILDGVDSRDFGVYLSGQGTFGAPSKAYTYHDVPGRNGALIGTEKRFNNIEVTYPAFIYANFKQNISDLRNFLLSRDGYVRLTDTYNSGEFRLASYVGAFEPEVTKKNDAGSFNIVFNCMPQRWLVSGETPITGSPRTIQNNTQFPSKPLIRVYGYGFLNVNGLEVYISNYLTAESVSFIDLDCETMQAFNGTKLLNSYVSVYRPLNDGYDGRDYAVDYPVLSPGENTIFKESYATYISSWEVTPRWWKL